MCTYKNSLENIMPNRGLYRVCVEAHDCGVTRLVSLWIDPAMKAFKLDAALREAEMGATQMLSSDDEPTSWRLLGEDGIVARGHIMKGKISRKHIRSRNFNDSRALLSART